MKKRMVLTVMGVMLLSTAAMAQSENNRAGYHNNGGGYHNSLNLTDEQYNKMQELRISMRAERDSAREAQRVEMEKFYNAPNFDAAEAQKLVNKYRSERDIRQMKNRHAMNQILTPEQRSQYRNMGHMRGKNMHGGKHMMKRNNHMNGPRDNG